MKNKQVKHTLSWLLIMIASFFELGGISFFRGSFGIYGSPAVLLLSGLIVGFTFLFLSKDKLLKPFQSTTIEHDWSFVFDFVLIGLGLFYCWSKLNYWIELYPFTIFSEGKGSDVIPQIRVMGNRFTNGVFPYQMITGEDWNYGHRLFPTYLPLTWMPFIGAAWLNMDYRIYAFGIFLLGFLFFYWKIVARNANLLVRLISIASPFFFFYKFVENDVALALVVETSIVGFYLLLATSLFNKKIIWLTIGLILCLLSRYAIILYVPLILLVWGFKNGWRQMFKISFAIAIAVIFIYIIPFLSQDPTIFSKGYEYHTKAALSSWENSDKAGITSKTSIFSAGLGMAVFLIESNEKPVKENLAIYQKLHLCLSLLAVFLLGLFYYFYQNGYDYRLFLLGGMKIYLVIFYNFIQYPFSYLFLVPIFISVPIIYFATHILIENTKRR